MRYSTNKIHLRQVKNQCYFTSICRTPETRRRFVQRGWRRSRVSRGCPCAAIAVRRHFLRELATDVADDDDKEDEEAVAGPACADLFCVPAAMQAGSLPDVHNEFVRRQSDE